MIKIFDIDYLFTITTFIDAVAFPSAHFGSGTGDIFLDNVGCSGMESSLLDCSYVSDSNIYCYYGHSEDVGVRCQGNGMTICILGVSFPYIYIYSQYYWYLHLW